MKMTTLNMKGGVFVLVFLIVSLNLVSASVELNTALLKVSLKENSEVLKSFSLSSIKQDDVFFSSEGVDGISFEEENVVLGVNEDKTISVKFNSAGLLPGVYFGNIRIKTSAEMLMLPVILEVESQDLFFDADLDIPPAYSSVSPGENLVVQVKVFDLTFGTNGFNNPSVNIDYSIYRQDGVLLVSEEDSLIVDKTASFSKSFQLSKDLERGNYFSVVQVKYGSSIGVSSAIFTIDGLASSGFTFGNFNSNFFIVLFAIIFIVGIGLMLYCSVKSRDKLFLDLKRENSLELKRQREFLLAQQKLLRNTGVPKQAVQKQIKEKVNNLKKVQSKRMEELKILKKKKSSPSVLKKKMIDWKSQGYNTVVLESKLNGVGAKEMSTLMSKWKKQGYKK
ncbi:hypothetical protein HOC29_03945 [archaeon]|jgi:hypothetical protein|nr:hypothetical protein [archaeon]MBT4532144.1 hypothetical protein [archaeon]